MTLPASPRRNDVGAPMVALLAVACGISVANLYYPQPVLHTIARALHTSSGRAGLVVTLSQVGYAVGLALLVPVGDIVARRRLVPAVLGVTAVAMAASAAAPGITVLVVLSLVAGAGSVAAQVLVPLAASLASDERRGRVVGTVMTGLLLGILLARTVAGAVADALSWRAVYLLAAILLVALAVVLARWLPTETERPSLSYGQLLRSTVDLVRTEVVLRRRALFGALAFAAFSVFWTTCAFLLSGPPYHYGDATIGLFGLVGAAGALCAQVAGRLADRGSTRGATLCFALLLAGSFAPLWLGRTSLAWLMVGILLLDVGCQGLQVTNQSIIYRLAPDARSRVNSAYMVSYFVGGASGSAAASVLYGFGGWGAVCTLGAVLGALAVLLAAADRTRPALTPPASAPAVATVGRAVAGGGPRHQ